MPLEGRVVNQTSPYLSSQAVNIVQTMLVATSKLVLSYIMHLDDEHACLPSVFGYCEFEYCANSHPNTKKLKVSLWVYMGKFEGGGQKPRSGSRAECASFINI